MEEIRAVGMRTFKQSDPSTIQDKFLVLYTGWYACPGDGEPISPDHHGWKQWFDEQTPDMERPHVDVYPDLSSYSPSELYPVPGLVNNTDEQCFLFSHFHWMAEHGVDGAFVERWVGNLEVGQEHSRKFCDDVMGCVREAAEKESRVFAIQYHVGSIPADEITNILEQDWENVVSNEKGFLSSPNYLREKGMPVIAVEGLGWRDAGHTPDLVRSIVSMFRRNMPEGVYIMAYIPTYWRTMEIDADPNPELVDVWLDELDAICPNMSPPNEERMKADVEFIRGRLGSGQRTVDYIAPVNAGESMHNMNYGGEERNKIRRNGGKFLWDAISIASKLGIRTLYGISWDDYCRGFALMPVVPHRNLLPQSDKCRFMALDEDGYDLPSDWYMRICGLAAEALHNKGVVSETFPLGELEDYWTIRYRLDHEACVSLLSEILGQGRSIWRRLVNNGIGLQDAQHLVDFLSKVIDDTALPMTHAKMKQMFLLLFRLARSFQVFPASYELQGIKCDLNNPVHHGGFGYVCKATHKGHRVCVKAVRLFQRQDSVKQLRAIAKELVLWSHLSHPNIVPFYGVWVPTTAVSGICIVSPWMENGNLAQYLVKYPDTPRLPLLSDVSAGLEFLHRSKIVHADLKACNVLVSNAGRAMITDFGASHIASTTSGTTTTTQSAMTPHWTAPELLKADNVRPSEASDVWAYGCVAYEVMTGKIPFHNKTPFQVLSALMKGNTTPLRADPDRGAINIDKRLRMLMKQCWDYDPKQRPKAEEVVQFFVDLKIQDDRPLPTIDRSALTAVRRANAHVRINYEWVYEVLELVGGCVSEGSS
ncbi:hypothetical protein AN958_05885 [Leucoagaricus sp. SymC.cos]|nr:hypothetical protein AN958_05885 [Leucoagaricus sp. SymC.cos]